MTFEFGIPDCAARSSANVSVVNPPPKCLSSSELIARMCSDCRQFGAVDRVHAHDRLRRVGDPVADRAAVERQPFREVPLRPVGLLGFGPGQHFRVAVDRRDRPRAVPGPRFTRRPLPGSRRRRAPVRRRELPAMCRRSRRSRSSAWLVAGTGFAFFVLRLQERRVGFQERRQHGLFVRSPRGRATSRASRRGRGRATGFPRTPATGSSSTVSSAPFRPVPR